MKIKESLERHKKTLMWDFLCNCLNPFLIIGIFICFKVGACEPRDRDIVVRTGLGAEMPSKEDVDRLAHFIIESDKKIDPEDKERFREAQKNFDVESLYSCLKPFLKNTYPKKSVDIVKAFQELDSAMLKAVNGFHQFFWRLIELRGISLKRKEEEDYSDCDHAYTLEIKPFFLITQGIGNKYMEIAKHYNRFGELKEAGTIPLQDEKTMAIGYIKDCYGYLLFPIKFHDSYHPAVIPYGEPRMGTQRKVLCKRGTIVEQSGILIVTTKYEQYPLQFQLLSGMNSVFPFFESLLGPAINLDDIENPVLNPDAEQLFIRKLDQLLDLKERKKENISFIPIPDTKEDYDFIQVLLLEDLIKARAETKGQENLMISHQIEAIEAETGKTIEEFLQDQQEVLIAQYEAKIQAEEKANSETDWILEEPIPTKKKNKNNKKNSPNKQLNQGKKQIKLVKKDTKEDIRKRATNQFEEYKAIGRQKWREVLKIVNVVVKRYPALNKANVNVTGSHITFHQPGKNSLTIAPKHSGRKQDLSLPAGTVNNFVSKLLNFAFNAE